MYGTFFLGIIKAEILQCKFDHQDPCTYGMPAIEEIMTMRGSYNQEIDIRTLENKSCLLF